ncbi:MAG: patatin-like phospholipase family protein [Candidatus Hydrogenedentes bacterium]|nr:patatin-like phospholipase family protein [Candidatus Hydrogenedentota bacterium]
MNQETPDSGPTRSPAPDRFCDVVMKGGITSGVVYPLAIARLAEQFTFKNVGGTSAGAIAAAAAAAAELGRNTGGFGQLAKLPDYLGSLSPDGKNTNLFGFFQPQSKTRKLFRVAVAGLGCGFAQGTLRTLWAAVTEFFVSVLFGSLPGVFFCVASLLLAHGWFLLACGVASFVLLVVGCLVGLGIGIMARVVTALPANNYGLCTGMSDRFFDPPRGSGLAVQSKPLTYWLMEYLDKLAARPPLGPPLTFGDLWGTLDPDAERQINLEMMTTCLTHGRPYRLPFRDDKDLSENRFYFSRRDFEQLFPKRIVDWLVNNPRVPRGESEKRRAENAQRRRWFESLDIYPMPEPADLPVVVAVRMSLSFPILLSAVPLFAVDWDRDPLGEKPERCWFSDGGVCSNFPVHFFDSALPRRPTFSIDLTEKPLGTPRAQLNPEMVESNSDGIREHWNRFEVEETCQGSTVAARTKTGLEKLYGFAMAFVATMQNWTDSTQSRLPGFRDRIVRVPLTPNEGGLNLNMPAPLIEELTKRGAQAGDKLLEHFGEMPGNTVMTWQNHRWLRMRSMIASLEKMLEQVDNACERPEGKDIPFDEWAASCDSPPSYNWESQEQRRLAADTLHALRQIMDNRQKAQTSAGREISAADGAPRPRPELRPRAQI